MYKNRLLSSVSGQNNEILSNTRENRLPMTGFWFCAGFYALRHSVPASAARGFLLYDKTQISMFQLRDTFGLSRPLLEMPGRLRNSNNPFCKISMR